MSESQVLVGIGHLGSTKNEGGSVKTMALGSCVAIIFLDPHTHAVGLVHAALPDSKVETESKNHLPGYYVDKGILGLLKSMSAFGCHPKGRGMFVKLVGGANVMDPAGQFNIGKRNILMAKKFLWRLGLGVVAEDVGGNVSRTVEVFVDSGLVRVSSPHRRDVLEI